MKPQSPQFKTALNHYTINGLTICLLCLFCSCKESNTLPAETIQIYHNETKQLNVVGKWKMDSIWTLKDGKKTKPRIGLINTFWIFDKNNNWYLESTPVEAKVENIEVELSNPMNKLKSKYNVTDSIISIKSLDLEYKILDVNSAKMYIRSLGIINEAYKFSSVKQ